ncbi:MAG TPA: hypothetical protein VMX16_06115 [Terriglobia bacterium]|nr:hypothetical protein [Terriglobia bacterium]
MAGATEAIPEGKVGQPVSRRRRPPAVETDGVRARFFLAREGSHGREPALDRELQSEAEALVESLKTGRSFYSVCEYRGVADCSSGKPQIRKEAV